MTSLQMPSRMIKSYFGWGAISTQQLWAKICYVTTILTISVHTGRKTTALTRILKFMCKIGRKRSLVWPQIRDLSSLYKSILWSTVSNAFVRSTNYVASGLISHVDGNLFETHLPITVYIYIYMHKTIRMSWCQPQHGISVHDILSTWGISFARLVK